MSEYELRLAQARLSEDAGEADKDNEDDSCVIPISSDPLELFNWFPDNCKASSWLSKTRKCQYLLS